MSRFNALALSRLPPIPIGTDTHAAILAARMADVSDRLNAAGIPYTVSSLKTDTVFITENAGAYRELLALTRRDDAIRAVLLATSWGPFLDALGATQVPAVARPALVASPRPYEYGTEAAADWADDETYRGLIQLAPEALSTCGPEGAYLFFALDTPGVKVATCYGPMSFGGTRAAPFAPLGEVHVPVVAADGDGTASGALVARVQAALSDDERRPIGDFVTVSAAVIIPYRIVATLRVGPGADPDVLKAEAVRRLQAQADRQHRPGAAALRQQFYGAAYVPGANGAIIVESVELSEPVRDVNAEAITPATPGAAYCAPYCTSITVNIEVVDV